jgi:hypothetical protein
MPRIVVGCTHQGGTASRTISKEYIMGYYIVTPNEASQQKYLLGRERVRALIWAGVFGFLTLVALVAVAVAGMLSAPLTTLLPLAIMSVLLLARGASYVSRANQHARHAAAVAPRWQPTIDA